MSSVDFTNTIKVVSLIIGLTIVSISFFGLGRFDSNKASVEYQVSQTFLLIGGAITGMVIGFLLGEVVVNGYCVSAIRKTAVVEVAPIPVVPSPVAPPSPSPMSLF